MATKTCPTCGGSGVQGYDIEKNQTCSGCSGRGSINVPGPASSGRKGGCFPAETKILTPNGWKRIVDLSRSSLVLSRDSNNNLRTSRVVRFVEHAPRKTLAVSLSDKTSFSATRVHSILTGRGWLRVGQLRRGDKVYRFDSDGKLSNGSVLSVTSNENLEQVYNLVIGENFTFIVQGCVAHSFTYFRSLRMFSYRALERLRGILRKYRQREMAERPLTPSRSIADNRIPNANTG